MFRKHYPNCCITIDCSKLFIEITSSLDKASACWSNYKHHYTVKCLIYITPNGTVSVFSNCHGGRATNVFIVQIVDFYKDCSLEIKSWPIGDSKFKTCQLSIEDFFQPFIAWPIRTQYPFRDIESFFSITIFKTTYHLGKCIILDALDLEYLEQVMVAMKNLRIINLIQDGPLWYFSRMGRAKKTFPP